MTTYDDLINEKTIDRLTEYETASTSKDDAVDKTMALRSSNCAFLDLCQELRDMIYEHALADDEDEIDHDNYSPASDGQYDHEILLLDSASRGSSDKPDPGWQHHLPTTLPPPTWLTLQRTCRQLRHEVRDFLARRAAKSASQTPEIRAHLTLDHPHAWTRITSIPPLSLLGKGGQVLHITLHLRSLYNPTTLPPSPALGQAIWSLVRRCTTHGPHLSRHSPLHTPLPLAKLKLHLVAPEEAEMRAHPYGNSWMQLWSYWSCLKWSLGVLARSASEGGKEGNGQAGVVGRVEGRYLGREWEGIWEAMEKEEGSGSSNGRSGN